MTTKFIHAKAKIRMACYAICICCFYLSTSASKKLNKNSINCSQLIIDGIGEIWLKSVYRIPGINNRQNVDTFLFM